ncbi:MAG: glutamine amidotransferase [Gemmatimonadota bacterium]|nr:glutamine amidotransferase [Gemmatimonadota bacterium]
MQSFFESLFEFLFKYRPVVFERGELAFGAPRPALLIALLAAAVAVPAVLTYARARGKSTGRDRAVLAGLRGAALALVILCLFRPMMVLAVAVPQRNVLGVLIDDSRSMRIADRDGEPRSEFVRRSFGGADSGLAAALGERYLVRYFRFSGGTDRAVEPGRLLYDGRRTRLGQALVRARDELASVPLAGLVVVSDGADNAANAAPDAPALSDAIGALQARGVPVFAVGVGRAEWSKDIQIGRVEAPRTALTGGSLAVTVTIAQRGYAGASVPLVVEDSGRIVTTRNITLPADGETAPVRVHVPVTAAGARRLRFRITPQPGEMVTENNERHALVVVTDRKEKVLYVEGEPRFEMKFLRRAVDADENLQLVTLQRTADGKFLRLGVDDSLELAAGFPKTREELFGYRGVVLGSIEASFFTVDQLRMLADFVGERGGGLLMLGGRRAFAEGGYTGTPLGEVLPVTLDGRSADSASAYFAEMRVAPTPFGAGHAATQIAPDEAASAARWRELPAVSAVNRVRGLKPGATALLTGTAGGRARQPVLAYQRYGRGKAIALPVQDSWMWQMHADIPLEDMTHEMFWRQMLRWLVSDVPGRVEVVASSDRIGAGEAVTVRADVNDEVFERVNGARVVARVTAPTGDVSEVPMEWSVERDGEYTGTFTPPSDGLYEVRVSAHDGAASLDGDATFVEAAEPGDEFFDAEMRGSLLERVAKETGGRFYTPETAAQLPKDVVYTRSGTTVMEQKDLWDMPAVFLLLIALVAAEWGYRRARGLA